MTELTEAGGPCSTKMSMRQFKRYGIVDVHASLRLIEKSCNQKERTPHRDVQYNSSPSFISSVIVIVGLF
jgi:hypothetical protein